MCGTMVVSYAIQGQAQAANRWQALKPHLYYHSFKLLSYTAVGAILGAIGSALNIGPIRGGVSIFAGIFMLIMAINMLNLFPGLRRVNLSMPRGLTAWLFKRETAAKTHDREVAATGRQSYTAPIVFGSLTGLMPCGPLQAMQLNAAGLGSAFAGGLSMFVFGLGTVPLMLGFGSFTSLASHGLKKRVMKLSAVVVAILGLIMLNRGLVLQGIPYNFNTAQVALKQAVGIQDKAATGSSKIAKGVQVVNLEVSGTTYNPSTLVVQQGMPVKLVIDHKDNNACAAQIVFPAWGVFRDLPVGKTVITFTPKESGTFSFSCGMGMMQGSVVVLEKGQTLADAQAGRGGTGAGASADGPSPTAVLFVVFALVGGAAIMAKRRTAAGPVAASDAASVGASRPGAAGTASRSAKSRGKNGRPVKGAARKHPAGTYRVLPGVYLSSDEIMWAAIALGLATILGYSMGSSRVVAPQGGQPGFVAPAGVNGPAAAPQGAPIQTGQSSP